LNYWFIVSALFVGNGPVSRHMTFNDFTAGGLNYRRYDQAGRLIIMNR